MGSACSRGRSRRIESRRRASSNFDCPLLVTGCGPGMRRPRHGWGGGGGTLQPASTLSFAMGRSRPSPWRAFPESCEWVLLGVPRRPGCGSARSKGLLSSSVPVAIEDRDVSWGREALVVGATGFEPATVCSQSRCATRLRHAPPDTICSGSNSSWVAAASRAGRGRPERPERDRRGGSERPSEPSASSPAIETRCRPPEIAALERPMLLRMLPAIRSAGTNSIPRAAPPLRAPRRLRQSHSRKPCIPRTRASGIGTTKALSHSSPITGADPCNSLGSHRKTRYLGSPRRLRRAPAAGPRAPLRALPDRFNRAGCGSGDWPGGACRQRSVSGVRGLRIAGRPARPSEFPGIIAD